MQCVLSTTQHRHCTTVEPHVVVPGNALQAGGGDVCGLAAHTAEIVHGARYHAV